MVREWQEPLAQRLTQAILVSLHVEEQVTLSSLTRRAMGAFTAEEVRQAVTWLLQAEAVTAAPAVTSRAMDVLLATGARNTMAYRPDGLRHQLWDSEANKLMVWDSQGPTGYGDLVEEAKP